MYIQSISISDLRCFSKTNIDFQYPQQEDCSSELPNVNLVMGNNGAGKSTLLKAISMASLSPIIETSGFVPHHFVRRNSKGPKKSADIRVKLLLHKQDILDIDKLASNSAELSIAIKKVRDIETLKAGPLPEGSRPEQWEEMYDDKSSAFLFIGYGASRRVESSATFDSSLRSKQRLLRYQRVASLFEEQVTLVPLPRWLPELKEKNPGRHKQVINLINRLLPNETTFKGINENDDYLYIHRGVTIPFGAMSDGYRAYIGWISDLLYHVCMGCPSGHKLVNNHGVVLVDEIDLHIHPQWQRTIIPRIAKALPKLQFIFTTHSPIVAGTLEATNLFVAEPNKRGIAEIHQFKEDILGLNANQILLSSYFGLKSTRAPSALQRLRDLAKKAREGDEDATIEYLNQLTSQESDSDITHKEAK